MTTLIEAGILDAIERHYIKLHYRPVNNLANSVVYNLLHIGIRILI